MAKKKTSMQKQVAKDELKPDNSKVAKGKQMALMNVDPKHSKEIERVGRAYRAKVDARLALQKGKGGEDELQQKLLELVKAEGFTRDSNGEIKFTVGQGQVQLILSPTKEKVKVKIKEEE